MKKIDINKVQRSTYLATVLKVLLEINNNKHNGDEITYNQKIVEALAIATAFQKHLPISSVETNVAIYVIDILPQLPSSRRYCRMARRPLATTSRAVPTSAKTAIHMVA